MNDLYSGPEIYYPRWLTPTLQTAVQEHPVVILTGARQVGKSTLLRQVPPFRDWRFQTMDDFDTLAQAQNHPEALWAGTDKIVLDEVQKAPELLPVIKQAVDNQPGRFRFILSGSANLLLMRQVSESLAGRAIYFILSPMTLGELNQNPPPTLLNQAFSGQFPAEGTFPTNYDLPNLLLRGLMPALLPLSMPESWVRWWDGYIRTYLERDLRQISQIDSLVDFRRVMELLALRTGQLLNQTEVARDAAISQPTVRCHRGKTDSKSTLSGHNRSTKFFGRPPGGLWRHIVTRGRRNPTTWRTNCCHPLDAYNRLTDFQPHKPTTKRRLHLFGTVEPPFI